ncbi:hypothetical protein J3U18_00195 [Gilliamella sp. B3482]|uniref:hypothetical protein n=1 Tax=Gilliamella sp. B3482 TaxID=2817991 RepID=UPI0022699A29|nr:hypothetical protein [Gilliamella sp. B3482]MCX8580113.1 hypothetical protein [Gilliamella sp. B3482]
MTKQLKKILINHNGFAYVKSGEDKLIISCDLISKESDGYIASAMHSDDFVEWAMNLDDVTEIIALLY